METQQISIKGLLEDLQNGYTRCVGDVNYDETIGSIQTKYNLNKSQVKEMFDHPKLKGKKTITAKAPVFLLLDDTEEVSYIEDTIQPEVITLEADVVEEDEISTIDELSFGDVDSEDDDDFLSETVTEDTDYDFNY